MRTKINNYSPSAAKWSLMKKTNKTLKIILMKVQKDIRNNSHNKANIMKMEILRISKTKFNQILKRRLHPTPKEELFSRKWMMLLSPTSKDPHLVIVKKLNV